ncbi:MAG: hypothetical protein H5U40_02435, partial [Polyangiaceae bacterium]|nr:hypothetical protein [Polyangiaceae bacterium]
MRPSVTLILLASLLTGCELIVDFDRSKIDASTPPPAPVPTPAPGSDASVDDASVDDAAV